MRKGSSTAFQLLFRQRHNLRYWRHLTQAIVQDGGHEGGYGRSGQRRRGLASRGLNRVASGEELDLFNV